MVFGYFHFISATNNSIEELYRISSDPDCLHNLANEPGLYGLMTELKTQLSKELKAQGDPRMFGKGHIFDEYVYADERTRGFYERFQKGEKLKASWVNDTDFETGPIEE